MVVGIGRSAEQEDSPECLGMSEEQQRWHGRCEEVCALCSTEDAVGTWCAKRIVRGERETGAMGTYGRAVCGTM